MSESYTKSDSEMQNVAREVLYSLKDQNLILLKGELGAGKTTFAQGVLAALEAEGPFTSPTFVIMNQYTGRIRLDHYDLYRLSGAEDLEDIGLMEIVGKESVSLVEWPEQCQLDVPAIHVKFTNIGADGRLLDISATDTFHQQLVLNWRQVYGAAG